MNKQLVITAFTLILAPALMATPTGAEKGSGSNSAASSPIKKPIARLKPLHGSGSQSPLVPNAGWAFSPIGGHRGLNTASPKTTSSSPTGKKAPHHVPSLTAYNSAPAATITTVPLPAVATAAASGYTARPTTAAAAAPTDLDSLATAASTPASAASSSAVSSLAAQVKMLTIANEQLTEENIALKAHLIAQSNRIDALDAQLTQYTALITAANKRDEELRAKKEERARQRAAARATAASESAVFQPITPVLVKDE